VLTPPILLRENLREEVVAWTTDKGYLCIGRIDRGDEKSFLMVLTLRTTEPIVCAPAYFPPDKQIMPDSGVIFAASQDGFVYAVRERDGKEAWRFSTGGPVDESPVTLGPFVFVCNQLGGMYCLRAADGSQLWWTPKITQFVAASRKRIYAADKTGRVHVLNSGTGAVLETLPFELVPIKVTNSESDRMYLLSKDGVVQCLRETELAKPLYRHHVEAEDAELAMLSGEESKAKDDKPEVIAKPTMGPSGGSSGGGAAKTSGGAKKEKSAKANRRGGKDSGANPYGEMMGSGKRGAGRGKRGNNAGQGKPAAGPMMPGGGAEGANK
jgi:hypothetical protein